MRQLQTDQPGRAISGLQLTHTRAAMSALFDDSNLVSSSGLVTVLALSEAAGLRGLADEHLSVPGDRVANAGLKAASRVSGMVLPSQ